MKICIEIPDDLARSVVPEGSDPARHALEGIAVEAYRAHRLSGAQLRRLLGIPSRYELDASLKERGVWLEYTIADFRREAEVSKSVLARRQQELEEERRKVRDLR